VTIVLVIFVIGGTLRGELIPIATGRLPSGCSVVIRGVALVPDNVVIANRTLALGIMLTVCFGALIRSPSSRGPPSIPDFVALFGVFFNLLTGQLAEDGDELGPGFVAHARPLENLGRDE